jgi:uncharacterized membrane protein (UPF0182 family)
VVTPTSVRGNDGGRNTTLASSGTPIAPLYLTMQLPGKDGENGQEFVLVRSFTPRRKANLAAFIIARNDPEHYGELVLYETNDSSALSPAQAASSIESDQFISSQFTLLNQQQSQVLRGDVQLLPIGDTIVYIRPVWVEGESSQTFPRYKFVAAVVGERAVLGNDVNDAVRALLTGEPTALQASVVGNGGNQGGNGNQDGSNGGNQGGGGTTTTTAPPTTVPPSGDETVAELLARADAEFADAEDSMRAGDFLGWATHIDNARQLVEQANRLASAAPPAGGTSATTTTTQART